MNSQSDGGVDDATQTESETTSEQAQESKPKVNSFAAMLIEEAAGMGHSIGDPKLRQVEAAESAAEETKTEETTEEPSEEETQAEETETEETEPIAAEKKSIEDQIEDYKARGEKPPWYLSRIADETRKKNDRTKERNDALEENQLLQAKVKDLESQLAQPSAPRTDAGTPLLNVWNETDIRALKSECGKWIAWCTRNPDGGEAVVGKDEQGNEVTKYLDADQVTNLKLGAEETLREGIPLRRQFLAARAEGDNKAVEIYPDYKNTNSDLNLEVSQYLREVPALQSIPDIKIWLGHAIRGRNLYLAEKNGKREKRTDDSASRIVKSSRTKIAPTMPKARGFVPRVQGADLEKAEKNLKEKGSQEAAEEWLAAKWASRGQSKKAERIE